MVERAEGVKDCAGRERHLPSAPEHLIEPDAPIACFSSFLLRCILNASCGAPVNSGVRHAVLSQRHGFMSRTTPELSAILESQPTLRGLFSCMVMSVAGLSLNSFCKLNGEDDDWSCDGRSNKRINPTARQLPFYH